jgi:hypothetical protein
MASTDPRDPQYGAAFVGTADKQTVTITGSPTGGTFTLSFGGQTTSGLAYNAATSAVQTALQGLSSIGSGNATVSGTPGNYVVTFAGTKATGSQALLTADKSGLTGGTNPSVTVAHTVVGSPVQQAARSGQQTVLDMMYLKPLTITVSASDGHYGPNGNMYHE